MKHFYYMLIVLFIGYGCGGNNDHLNIALASNLQLPMDSIIQVFENEHHIKCNFSASSSGMLTSQIENGAPYDIFVSANKAYTSHLSTKGICDSAHQFALGQLYLIYHGECSFETVEALINSPKIKRIGIADEHTAPFGFAAKQVIDQETNILDYTSKLVNGESIAQVNQYLISGAVDAAFTSSSFFTKFGNAYSTIKIDDRLYDPIEQSAVILNKGTNNHKDECQKFVDFLDSKAAKDILIHFGYKVK